MNNFKDYLSNAKTPKSEEDINATWKLTNSKKRATDGHFVLNRTSNHGSFICVTEASRSRDFDLSSQTGDGQWSISGKVAARDLSHCEIYKVSLGGIVIGTSHDASRTYQYGETWYTLHMIESVAKSCDFTYLSRFGKADGWPPKYAGKDDGEMEVYFGISSLYKNCKILIADQKDSAFNPDVKNTVSFNFLNCRFENCHIENTSSIKLNYPGCEFVNTEKI